MTNNLPSITYRFHLPERVEEITLNFDPEDFRLVHRADLPMPAWAALEFRKCHHCPLNQEESPACPFALSLSGFVESFSHLESYNEIDIEVITPTRSVTALKPLQSGIASLVGLIGATSGCPHLAFYRPMARFHLPFAEEDETLYRVLSMFLLRTHLLEQPIDLELLSHAMNAVGDVNAAMAERIKGGFDRDAMVNAIVILDCFAMTVPLAIEDSFNTLRPLFP